MTGFKLLNLFCDPPDKNQAHYAGNNTGKGEIAADAKISTSKLGLKPYSGVWGSEQLLHLLRRTLFGVSCARSDEVQYEISGHRKMQKNKAYSTPYLDADKQSNISYSEEKPNATAITFELATPYTVINDGKNRAVDLKQEDIPAIFEYFGVPKLDKNIYLIGHIPNWIDYNLMEGEVNLYYEGTYLGKTLFSLSNAEDTLHLSLGHAKGISTVRNKVKEFSKRQILSDKKTASSAFEINIRNNKKFPINLVLEDQLPISAEKEITIENPLYEGAQLEEGTGKLTWKFNLDAGKDKKLKLSYTVKYPKTYRVQID